MILVICVSQFTTDSQIHQLFLCFLDYYGNSRHSIIAHFYRLRSMGDNTFGTVRPSVIALTLRVIITRGVQNGCVCNLLLFRHVGLMQSITLLIEVTYLFYCIYWFPLVNNCNQGHGFSYFDAPKLVLFQIISLFLVKLA